MHINIYLYSHIYIDYEYILRIHSIQKMFNFEWIFNISCIYIIQFMKKCIKTKNEMMNNANVLRILYLLRTTEQN